MTLEALHIAGACFTSAVLAVVLVLWIVAEQRRAAAEARADSLRAEANALRGQAVVVLVELVRLTSMADNHLSAWADETPQAWTLAPEQERVRLAHSATFSALRLTRGGLAAFQGDHHHGRQA